MSIYYKRQNDYEAIRLYKASTYCYQKEYRLKYTIIFFSLLFCFIGIFLNSYLKLSNLDFDSEEYDKLKKLVTNLNDINSIAASIYLILQIFLNILCANMHRDAVYLEEMYDNYVYGLKPNNYTTRKISDPVIDNYARKIRKSDRYFQSKYFKIDNVEDTMIFNNQKSIIQENYDVLNYSKEKWFNPAWLFIIVIIIVFSFVVDDSFIGTLKTIIFPSMTAISMIVHSWNSHTVTTNKIHTSLDALNKTSEPNSQTTLRNAQDAIFNIRMVSFMMPKFISNKYRKYDIRQRKKIDKLRFKENYRLAYEEIVKRETSFDIKTTKNSKKNTPVILENKPAKSITTSAKIEPKTTSITTKEVTPVKTSKTEPKTTDIVPKGVKTTKNPKTDTTVSDKVVEKKTNTKSSKTNTTKNTSEEKKIDSSTTSINEVKPKRAKTIQKAKTND